jgi:uroporphyrin-III C-methyltransferase/precorrin-2 dehydrogenase/sirohydrochlorin ferrochelatase
MRYFPLFLDLGDRDVLVVGGAAAALRKALVLAASGARVTVVAQNPGAGMAEAVECGQLRLLRRPFSPADVQGCTLVVAASDDEAADAAVSAAAKTHSIPINVLDRPELSTFVWPAMVDRDPVTVAVCSGGAAPVLARSIRARIEAMLPADLGRLARFADSFRSAVKATRRSGTARRRFWERFFEGPIAAQVLSGDERGARERMLATINRRDETADEEGIVYLVGAGPGDAELLTLKALRLLQAADVIVHDRLVGPRVLEYARRDADHIDVGKAPGHHPFSQDQINALLLSHARAGRRVVRLKGGDPFIFGRGGEEREFLLRHGIRVEVVPGITAATGCAAAAGIPLTFRGEAQTLSIVTGHGERGDPDFDWPALAADDSRTICVYMGAAAAGRIACRLIAHGRDPATPVAVIVNGTLPEQRILTGHLRDLAMLTRAAGSGPALLIIGEVVRRADAWTSAAGETGSAVAAAN